MISGGIGITPLCRCLNVSHTIAPTRRSTLSMRRNSRHHVFDKEVRRLAAERRNIHAHVRYDAPLADDLRSGGCDSVGLIDLPLLQKLLPSRDADFYLCGPKPFMRGLLHSLQKWGVADSHIHYEYFGPRQDISTPDATHRLPPRGSAPLRKLSEPHDMESQFSQVVASYHRARRTGQLFDTFYELFLAKSPRSSDVARTDFPHQKLMLRESILEMLVFAQTGSGGEEIKQLAERHRQLNVTRAHYGLWLDALCESLAKHDCEFSSDLERIWRDSMQKGIELMAADRN